MNTLEELLLDYPVVGAIRCEDDLPVMLSSNTKIVFILYGSLLTIGSICAALHAQNKIIFVHIDLIEGLRADYEGIIYLKEIASPYGLISTKPTALKHASSLGMKTILRLFILDSSSLKSAHKNIQTASPTALEVLPGIASKAITSLAHTTRLPIIAGGLIETKREATAALSAGALAISTSTMLLWD